MKGISDPLQKGLSQIADSSPQTEFVTVLYPTTRLKEAVSELYALLIRFFLRAQDWDQERKPMQVLHSLTRPVELRCVDLIEDIGACTRTVYRLGFFYRAGQTTRHSLRNAGADQKTKKP